MCIRDRRNINKKNKNESLDLSFDVINWRKSKFKKSLQDFKMPSKTIRFLLDDTRISVIKGFKRRFSKADDNDFYYAAIDFVRPKSSLLHVLSYEDKKNQRRLNT